jgi:hypothetical protein
MGSGGASNAVAEIAKVLGHAPILVRAFTSHEVEVGSGTARLLAFGDELLPPSTREQVAFQPAVAGSVGTRS